MEGKVTGGTAETRFGLGVVKKYLNGFSKTHKNLTKECTKLTRENMKDLWPLWKEVLHSVWNAWVWFHDFFFSKKFLHNQG